MKPGCCQSDLRRPPLARMLVWPFFPRRAILLVVTFVAASFASASSWMTQEQYRADVQVILDQLAAQYPGFTDQRAEVMATVLLNHPPPSDRQAVALRFRQAVALLHDSHACVDLPDEALIGAEVPPALPFNLTWVAGRFLLDSVAAGLPLDSEVVSLDDRPINSVIAGLVPLACVDAAENALPQAEVARQFAYLRQFLSAAEQSADVAAARAVKLVVRTPLGERRSFLLRHDGQQWLLDRLDDDAPPYPAVFFEARAHPGSGLTGQLIGEPAVLLLTIGSFIDPPALFASQLDAIWPHSQSPRPHGVVIDLRGNAGGRTENAGNLLARLITSPLPFPAYYHLTQTPLPSDAPLQLDAPAEGDAVRLGDVAAQIQRVNRIKARFADLTSRRAHPGRGFMVAVSPLNPLAQDTRQRLADLEPLPVVVITNRQTASAARLFAKSLLAVKGSRGFHVGPVALNALPAGCSQPAFAFKLPHSGLLLRLPWLCFEQPPIEGEANRFALIEPQIDDLRQNRDPALAAALHMLGQ